MDNNKYIRMSNSLKYIALYWNLGFMEEKHDYFVKNYQNIQLKIYADKQSINFQNKIKVSGGEFLLNSHKSFVVLELVNRLIELNYSPENICIHLDKNYDVSVNNLYFKCYVWGEYNIPKEINNSSNYIIYYQSRLVSGCIEYEYNVDYNGNRYNEGLLETNTNEYKLSNRKELVNNNPDFEIVETKLISYKGNDKIVKVPNGITALGPSVFWDNQYIEEVIFPNTVINMGGDTFYNCFNLKKFTIPASAKYMGDNPFAGCPLLELKNESDNFIYENGALYNKTKTTLIYYNLKNKNKTFEIPNTVKIVGKHSFYLCNLEKITIPESVYRLANNPFSSSKYLHLISKTTKYKVINDVIYTGDMSTIVGALNSIDCDVLKLEDIEVISRNAFYNCKGIKKIILPATLKQIGYNPFVNCSNIIFESLTPSYVVKDGVLYTKDLKKLICYPSNLAIGHIKLLDSVVELERGAFSGCTKLQSIDLHNVSLIGKSCFTNCDSLNSIYLSDLVSYVGEWAFAHCKNMKSFSCYKDCFIDARAFQNNNCKVIIRNDRENYLIESNNIYSLESMLSSYKNKIDSILIDPPYNSHIDYIGYKDGDYKEGYLNFMNDRIKLSYKLLSDKGFLVINIDEGEVFNLANLCQDIFGDNFVSIHKWKKKHPYFDINRVVLNPNKIQTDFEYIIICKKSNESSFNKIMQPYIQNNKLLEKESDIPETFDCFGTTSSAKDEINELFGRRDYFSTPKPLKLMLELIRGTTSKNSIIMDFFAGSGTVGHAVNELNKLDNGNRKFILISNNESNICKEVTKKRLDIINSNYKFLD